MSTDTSQPHASAAARIEHVAAPGIDAETAAEATETPGHAARLSLPLLLWVFALPSVGSCSIFVLFLRRGSVG